MIPGTVSGLYICLGFFYIYMFWRSIHVDFHLGLPECGLKILVPSQVCCSTWLVFLLYNERLRSLHVDVHALGEHFTPMVVLGVQFSTMYWCYSVSWY